MTTDGDHESHERVFPPAEALNYGPEELGLTRSHIDWDLIDPKTREGISPAEAAERDRRITSALLALADEIDGRFPPKPGEEKLYELTNRVLNPDRYPLTDESTEVEPTEPPSREGQS